MLILEINILFNLQQITPMNATLENLIEIGHTHKLVEAWLLVLVGHPTSIPSISSLFKSKSKWTSLPHAKSTNLIMLYSTFTISSLANCIYSLISILPIAHVLHFQDSKIQRSQRIARFKGIVFCQVKQKLWRWRIIESSPMPSLEQLRCVI